VRKRCTIPLKKGYGKKTQEANFHELKKAHPEMPDKQRAAIVLSTAAKAAKKAGKPGAVKGPKRRASKGKAK
jgi:hypothetical protein